MSVLFDPDRAGADSFREHTEDVQHDDDSRARGRLLLITGLAVLLAGAGYAGYVVYPRFDLPGSEGAGLLVLATGAGVASFFSPCAFPLMVTFLARSAEGGGGSGRRVLTSALAVSVGAVLFLTLVGGAIALGAGALIESVTFDSAVGRGIRFVVGGLLVVLGLRQSGVLSLPIPGLVGIAEGFAEGGGGGRVRAWGRAAAFGFVYLVAGFG